MLLNLAPYLFTIIFNNPLFNFFMQTVGLKIVEQCFACKFSKLLNLVPTYSQSYLIILSSIFLATVGVKIGEQCYACKL